MDIQIKNYADSKNIKELKYIFVDALDVDPTFVRYEEEYNYCKSIPGLLEPHIELTPFIQDKSRWDETYWTSLKTDLIKNFSDQRMMHMKEVAQIFLSEKVQRILAERCAVPSPSEASTTAPTTVSTIQEEKTEEIPAPISKAETISREEQQKREIEAERRRIEEDNRRALEAEKADAERIKRQQQIHNFAAQKRQTGTPSKKAIGIAVAALAVAAVILILVLK